MTDRGRDDQGNPNILWIDKDNIAFVLEDVFEGSGVKYIRADHIVSVNKEVADKERDDDVKSIKVKCP